jgi:hypothetical protein
MRLAGIILLGLALAGCGSAPSRTSRNLVDQGYLLGAGDTIKQLYWAKQALEEPRRPRPEGSMKYYVWEESGIASDGRKLAPGKVAVPVFVPAPAPAERQFP